jgi:hypothetical protein
MEVSSEGRQTLQEYDEKGLMYFGETGRVCVKAGVDWDWDGDARG